MVRRLIVVGLLISTCLLGQRSDTIYQNLGTDNTGNWTTANVTNIGQSGHSLFVSMTGAGCGHLIGGLQYSFDGTNYYPFGTQQVFGIGSNGAGFLMYGAGAYPFVRGQFSYNVVCTISGFYSGTLYPPYILSQGSLPLNQRVDLYLPQNSPQPLVGGFLAATAFSGSIPSGTTTAWITPNVEGVYTQNINVATGTTDLIATPSPDVYARVYVSHIELTADTAGTTVTLSEGTQGTTCGTNPITLGTWKLAQYIPLNIGKIRTIVLGDDLCLGGTSGGVLGSITYGIMSSTQYGY